MLKMESRILDRVKSPADIKKLSLPELDALAGELRSEILSTVAKNGGHLASNLGSCELTIALHKVFDTPRDRILWDVGHQSYAHKILTGRADVFSTIRKYGGLSGFPKPAESEYDPMTAGHAGTAISGAMGFSAANEINGVADHTVAVVGDGALICGISLEAMNNLRDTCKNLVIVVNDNKMSISRSIGAIPRYLNSLITGRNYNRFKALTKMMLHKLPGGKSLIGGIQQIEASTKSLFVPGVFFEEMGIRYIGPIDGHNIDELVKTLESARESNRPILVHVMTEKGRGCEFAENAPEKYHGIGGFDPATGLPSAPVKRVETFSGVFGRKLFELASRDEKVVAVTAAMSSGCGITDEFVKRFPERFFDVGIAEEHAVVFSSGLAAAGMRPVCAMYSTFLQRALDCVFHDMCLQNLPVLLCIDRAGAVEDGPTHHGIYDMSFLRSIPNLAILSPRCGAELEAMMEAAYSRAVPCAVRYPRGSAEADSPKPSALEWGRAETVEEGSSLAIFSLGREFRTASAVASILRDRYGVKDTALVNVRFIRPFDTSALIDYASRMPVVTLEDHVKTGGLASCVAETLVSVPHKGVLSFGWDADKVIQHGDVNLLRREHGLDPESMAKSISERFFSSLFCTFLLQRGFFSERNVEKRGRCAKLYGYGISP